MTAKELRVRWAKARTRRVVATLLPGSESKHHKFHKCLRCHKCHNSQHRSSKSEDFKAFMVKKVPPRNQSLPMEVQMLLQSLSHQLQLYKNRKNPKLW